MRHKILPRIMCLSAFLLTDNGWCAPTPWEKVRTISEVQQNASISLEALLAETHIPNDSVEDVAGYPTLQSTSNVQIEALKISFREQYITPPILRKMGMVTIFQAVQRVFSEQNVSFAHFFHAYFMSNSSPEAPLLAQIRYLMSGPILNVNEQILLLQGVTCLLRANDTNPSLLQDSKHTMEEVFCSLAQLTGLTPHTPNRDKPITMRINQMFHTNLQEKLLQKQLDINQRYVLPIDDKTAQQIKEQDILHARHLDFITRRVRAFWPTDPRGSLPFKEKERDLYMPTCFKATQTSAQFLTNYTVAWFSRYAARKAGPCYVDNDGRTICSVHPADISSAHQILQDMYIMMSLLTYAHQHWLTPTKPELTNIFKAFISQNPAKTYQKWGLDALNQMYTHFYARPLAENYPSFPLVSFIATEALMDESMPRTSGSTAFATPRSSLEAAGGALVSVPENFPPQEGVVCPSPRYPPSTSSCARSAQEYFLPSSQGAVVSEAGGRVQEDLKAVPLRLKVRRTPYATLVEQLDSWMAGCVAQKQESYYSPRQTGDTRQRI